jgi:hypothetical protein
MAWYAGRHWTREQVLERVGDPSQIAFARGCVLCDGKAEGVRAVEVATGSGLAFTVLPGRGMDISSASFRGMALSFQSATGITSPAYYEESGTAWLRTFYAGLLTTCGITNAGVPSVDGGRQFGLHGRVANAAAEDLCVEQDWQGDEFEIRVAGTVREATAMAENMRLRRSIETRLGARGFRLRDTVTNRGFEPQPLMLLYHFNYGFPLLSPGSRVVGPIRRTEARDEQARAGRGVEECLRFPEPVQDYQEKVFFHSLAAGADGRTFIALVTDDCGNGTPLGVVCRWNAAELPCLTQWKMPCRGFYVVGLEPGTVTPMGRGPLRAAGTLPLLEGQASRSVTIDVEVLDSAEEISAVEQEAARLL